MSIPFGIEWAPAFRQLADISQLIFTIGPFLFVGIFVILKIRSKREDEDIMYNKCSRLPAVCRSIRQVQGGRTARRRPGFLLVHRLRDPFGGGRGRDIPGK